MLNKLLKYGAQKKEPGHKVLRVVKREPLGSSVNGLSHPNENPILLFFQVKARGEG